MKVQIRRGVFETNSSSEHSLAIVNTKDFKAWKEGKMYARQLDESEAYEETWGNFWSNLDHFEFKEMNASEADLENRKLFDESIQKDKTDLDLYWKHLEEVKDWKVGEDEYFETEENKQNWINTQKKFLEEDAVNIEKQSFDHYNSTRKFYNGFWITYDEYINALKNGDCYSPFEHTQGDTSVFGIYYHS